MLYIGVDLGTSAVKLLMMDENGNIQKIYSATHNGSRTEQRDSLHSDEQRNPQKQQGRYGIHSGNHGQRPGV